MDDGRARRDLQRDEVEAYKRLNAIHRDILHHRMPTVADAHFALQHFSDELFFYDSEKGPLSIPAKGGGAVNPILLCGEVLCHFAEVEGVDSTGIHHYVIDLANRRESQWQEQASNDLRRLRIRVASRLAAQGDTAPFGDTGVAVQKRHAEMATALDAQPAGQPEQKGQAMDTQEWKKLQWQLGRRAIRRVRGERRNTLFAFGFDDTAEPFRELGSFREVGAVRFAAENALASMVFVLDAPRDPGNQAVEEFIAMTRVAGDLLGGRDLRDFGLSAFQGITALWLAFVVHRLWDSDNPRTFVGTCENLFDSFDSVEGGRNDLRFSPIKSYPPTVPIVIPDVWSASVFAIKRELEAQAKAELTKPPVPTEARDNNGKRLKGKQRISRQEANVKAREHLAKNPTATIRQLSVATGCSIGILAQTTARKAVQAERKKGRKPKPPKAVGLTDKALASTPARDDEQALNELIKEQKTDGKSDGSIEPFRARGKSRFVPRRNV